MIQAAAKLRKKRPDAANPTGLLSLCVICSNELSQRILDCEAAGRFETLLESGNRRQRRT